MKISKSGEIGQRRTTQFCFKPGINTSFWEIKSPLQTAAIVGLPLLFSAVRTNHLCD